MIYRTMGDTVVARLQPGEEILDSIKAIAAKEHITAGYINGLGASDDFDVCVYDLKEKKYFPVHVGVQSEITSLFGIVSKKDGSPFLHVHMQAMTKDGTAAGGHLQRCVINATAEIVIHVLPGEIGRMVDPATGLTVVDL